MCVYVCVGLSAVRMDGSVFAVHVCVFCVWRVCVGVCVSRLTEEKKGLNSETETIRAKLKKREREGRHGREETRDEEEMHMRKEGKEGQDNAALSPCGVCVYVCVREVKPAT